MCIGILNSQLKSPLMLLLAPEFYLPKGRSKVSLRFLSLEVIKFCLLFLDFFSFEDLYWYLVVSIYWSVLLVPLFAKWAPLIYRLKWFLSSFYLYLSVYCLSFVLILCSGALTIRISVTLVFLCHYLNILVLLLNTWKNYLSFS